jgi:hypothetical protein
MLSNSELHSWYRDALSHCTSQPKDASDDVVEHELFEEFDTGAHSFLHDDTLERLREAGYLNAVLVTQSAEVRRRWIELRDRDRDRPAEEIRKARDWNELFSMCDRIIELLETE